MSVYLVGAGCGRPGLLTVEASEKISRARHVVYDRLIHPDILQLAPPGCEFHLAGKQESSHTLPQDEINELLVRLGGTGETVVRLKGGDPFVFGRGGEEAEYLEKNGIPWRAVPGVTSALGGALLEGLPLTMRTRSSSLVLATGHRRPESDDNDDYWRRIAEAPGVVALYMASSCFGEISERLTRHGMSPDTPVNIVRWGGWGRAERTRGTLGEIGRNAGPSGLPSPSVIYIGDAADVGLSPERGELRGMQIAVCRPYPECWRTARALEDMSADCYGLPLLSLKPIPVDSGGLDTLKSADWLVITSPRAARELKRVVGDVRLPRGRVVSIGESTSEALRESGIPPMYTADGSSRGLASRLKGVVSPGERAVFARNERGSGAAVGVLKEMDVSVADIPIYRMVPTAVPGIEVMREQWGACGLDAVVFGSSAQAEEYARALGDPPDGAKLIAWGAACADSVRNIFGKEPIGMAAPDMVGLVDSLKGLVDDDNGGLLRRRRGN